MRTQGQKEIHCNSCISAIKNVLLTSLLMFTGTSAFAEDSYQIKMLFTPTESMLMTEAEGNIMIYEGLDSETVDRAMNEQFDRIDNMMFVRIQHVQDDGEYLVEDDGCD